MEGGPDREASEVVWNTSSYIKYQLVYFKVRIFKCSYRMFIYGNHIWIGGLEHFLFFHSVGNNNPNWLSYFSEGLKPPGSISLRWANATTATQPRTLRSLPRIASLAASRDESDMKRCGGVPAVCYHAYVDIILYIYIYICVCVCIDIRNVYVHIYIYRDTHTYIQICLYFSEHNSIYIYIYMWM